MECGFYSVYYDYTQSTKVNITFITKYIIIQIFEWLSKVIAMENNKTRRAFLVY